MTEVQDEAARREVVLRETFADMARIEMEPNRLNDQPLVRIFEAEWRHVVR